MKSFNKLIIITIILSFVGCWNMFNDTMDDLDDEYKFFIAVANCSPTANGTYVSTFSINSTGELNPVSKTTEFTSTGFIYYADVSPDGNYLYALNTDLNKIYIYSVGSNGLLNYQSEINTGLGPVEVIVHPSGKYVYCSNFNSSTISMYSVDNDGNLTTISTGSVGLDVLYNTDYYPYRMCFHPSGDFLYVSLHYNISNADISNSHFASFTVNNTDGSLTFLEKPSIATTSKHSTHDIIVHPNGQYLYVSVAEETDEEVNKFNINSDGTVVSPPDSYSSASGNYGNYFAIHPSGNVLYCAVYNGVRSFQINQADGALTLIDEELIDTNDHKLSDISIHPNRKHLYAASTDDHTIYHYKTDNTGSISLIEEITDSEYLSGPGGLILFRNKIN